jgi:cell division protease FtsH
MIDSPAKPAEPNVGPPSPNSTSNDNAKSLVPKWSKDKRVLYALLLTLVLFTVWWSQSGGEPETSSVDYSTFHSWVQADKVASVELQGASIEGVLKVPDSTMRPNTTGFKTVRPESDDGLVPLLLEKQVKIRAINDQATGFSQVLAIALPWVLIIGGWMYISRRATKMMPGGGAFGGMFANKNRKFDHSASVPVTFADVAGHHAAKRDLQEVVLFLKEPVKFQRLGGKVPRGILLVGPPGTGKTLLARAVAGESGVPFFSVSASEFIEMFVGVGARRVRELFAESKRSAPAIIFIDEIDAVGRSRGTGYGGGHDEREQTLNQLLSEMDGFERNDLTIVLAATNRPDVLDPALLRPGRFDRRIVVGRPEVKARKAILDVHVRNKPLGQDVDIEAIAKSTPGFSGADLANLVNEAALHATRRDVDAIGSLDFREAQDKIVLGDPSEVILNAGERHRVAVHESGHAVVAQFSPESEALHRVTILPRGMALGVTQQSTQEDRHILTEPQLRARLRVLMGGYAAERLVFESVSTGGENDLKEATGLATKMVAHFGMSAGLGAVYYDNGSEHPFLGQRLATDGGASDQTNHAIESETRLILSRALDEARQLLEQYRTQLDTLGRVLFEKETLEAAELGLVLKLAAE